MTQVNGSQCGGIIVNFHEAKPAGLTCEPIAHNSYGIYGNPLRGKEVLNVLLVCHVGKVPHKKLLHSNTP